jgi:hypothetical protein
MVILVDVIVDVIVIVIARVIVAALVNGNDTVGVIDAVDEDATSGWQRPMARACSTSSLAAHRVRQRLTSGHADLAGQLRRAGWSVVAVLMQLRDP